MENTFVTPKGKLLSPTSWLKKTNRYYLWKCNHLQNNTFFVGMEKGAILQNIFFSMTINTLLKQLCASPEKLGKWRTQLFFVWLTPLLCLTLPNHETRGQREVHVTVSHSNTSYDRKTEKENKKYIRLSHRARTSKNERQALASSLRFPDLSPIFFIENMFSEVSYAYVEVQVQDMILVQ